MEKWIAELHDRGRNHFRQYSSVAAGAKQLQQTNPRLSSEQAFALARSGMKQNAQGKWIWKFDPLHRTISPQPFYSAQAIEFFRRIECPVLVVDGKQSCLSQRPDKQQRLAVIRDKHFVEIDNAGHMVHLDNMAGVVNLNEMFISDDGQSLLLIGPLGEAALFAIDDEDRTFNAAKKLYGLRRVE